MNPTIYISSDSYPDPLKILSPKDKSLVGISREIQTTVSIDLDERFQYISKVTSLDRDKIMSYNALLQRIIDLERMIQILNSKNQALQEVLDYLPDEIRERLLKDDVFTNFNNNIVEPYQGKYNLPNINRKESYRNKKNEDLNIISNRNYKQNINKNMNTEQMINSQSYSNQNEMQKEIKKLVFDLDSKRLSYLKTYLYKDWKNFFSEQIANDIHSDQDFNSSSSHFSKNKDISQYSMQEIETFISEKWDNIKKIWDKSTIRAYSEITLELKNNSIPKENNKLVSSLSLKSKLKPLTTKVKRSKTSLDTYKSNSNMNADIKDLDISNEKIKSEIKTKRKFKSNKTHLLNKIEKPVFNVDFNVDNPIVEKKMELEHNDKLITLLEKKNSVEIESGLYEGWIVSPNTESPTINRLKDFDELNKLNNDSFQNYANEISDSTSNNPHEEENSKDLFENNHTIRKMSWKRKKGVSFLFNLSPRIAKDQSIS